MKRLLTIITFFMTVTVIFATTAADSLYLQQSYLEAAKLYAQDSTSDAYYNLGNCHYRLKNYGECVLAYQRALWLNPGNRDAAHNLAITRTHLTDHFNAPAEMFFITMVKEWRTGKSYQTWLKWAVFMALLACLTFYGFRLSSKSIIRKIFFGGIVLTILMFIVCNVFAIMQMHEQNNYEKAVVMTGEAAVYASPVAKGKPVRILHEGTTVEVQDTHGKDWVFVTLPDGTQNWMASSQIQNVKK